MILSLYNARRIKLFILDPSDNINAANVRMNILDNARGMGDIDAWLAFLIQNGVVENQEVAATVNMTALSLAGSGGGW